MSTKDNKIWATDVPPVPDSEYIINDQSCYGILGRTLAEALDEIETLDNRSRSGIAAGDDDAAASSLASEEVANHSNSEPKDPQPPLLLDTETSKRIMNALGESMAKCYRTSVAGAPSALLRGQIDHFNRLNNKWRIVVDNAQFRRRFPLEKHRRRSDRRSLWYVSKEKESTGDDPTKFKLEVLAFNDVD